MVKIAKIKCGYCEKLVSKSNYARHRLALALPP